MHKESHFQLAVLQQAMACMYYWRTHNKRGGVVVAVNAYVSKRAVCQSLRWPSIL